MKLPCLMALTAAMTLCTGVAVGHEQHYAFGQPGIAKAATRTYHYELSDSMRFVTRDKVVIRRGETVKFVIKNSGRLAHEFSLGDAAFQKAHAEMMKAMPDMKHVDPNMVSVPPGETRTLVWTFSAVPPSGIVQIACHLAGHFEAGMKADLRITQ